MATYTVNRRAIAHARKLIDARDDYAEWHLGLIRAAAWRHKEIELAAHDLLQYIDKRAPKPRGSGRSQA